MVLITLDETPMDENKMTKTRKNELDCLEKRIKAKEHFCVLIILKKLKLQNWEIGKRDLGNPLTAQNKI